MTTSLQFPTNGDDAQRVTPLVAEELKRAILPVKRHHRSHYIRNLIRRVQKDHATPHVHAFDLMAAKHGAGESFENGVAFPMTLMAQARMMWFGVEAPYQDFATINDTETEMQALLDRVQFQLCACVTPALIRNALDAIARYRVHLDALEAFLRARLEQQTLKVAR